MGRYIVKIKDRYLEWSTIVDAPVTGGMTLRNFRSYYLQQYGKDGMRGLSERLERAEKTGTSALDRDYESLLRYNRAGKNECQLTEDQIYAAYCRREKIDGWSPYRGAE